MKKFLVYLSTFLFLFGVSVAFAEVFSENFEDGVLDDWVLGSGDYVISNGELHMLNGFDNGKFIGASIDLQLSNELIHYFSADIRAPAITNEFVGLTHQWYQQDGTGLQIYYKMHRSSQSLQANLFYIELGEPAIHIAQENLWMIDPNVMNTLSIELHDTYVTVGLNGIERDIFDGSYYYPETISNSGAYVHAHDTVSVSDINFYVDNLEANSSPLSTHLLSTSWHQGYPYRFRSDFDDDGELDDFNEDGILDEWVVGCNAVAVGQLINYYFQQGYRDLGWLHNLPINEDNEWFKNKYKYTLGEEESVTLKVYTGVGMETVGNYPNSIVQDDPSTFEGGELHRIWHPDPPKKIFMPYFEANTSDPEKNELQKFLIWIALGLESEFVLKEECGVTVGVTSDNLKEKDLIERFGFKDGVDLTWKFDLTVEGIKKHRDYIIESIDRGDPILIKVYGNKRTACGEIVLMGGDHTALIDGYLIDDEDDLILRFNWGFSDENANGFYPKNKAMKHIEVDANGDGINDFGFKRAQIFKNTSPDI